MLTISRHDYSAQRQTRFGNQPSVMQWAMSVEGKAILAQVYGLLVDSLPLHLQERVTGMSVAAAPQTPNRPLVQIFILRDEPGQAPLLEQTRQTIERLIAENRNKLPNTIDIAIDVRGRAVAL